uniref:Acetylornithine aminotransferase n=1 Tax=Magnetococcus massalia (strain MO-1) TaxID=451514 RepID=A0A1S7LP68_MAGMO|nr:acetylornithine transaminase (NAcOATase and DapATase), PLP-dependent [Candidatus Magnetococcus massalia]
MSDKQSSIMSTYGRYPVAFEKGEGVALWDIDGRRYLDFLSGIGVNNLGHAHPHVVEAVQQQVAKLTHTSNLYRIPLQEELATRLTSGSFADAVFFSNSGADANEAAIKLVRKYMKDHGQPGRYEIITAVNSFHGRTLATLTASGQEKVQQGFDPLVPGFRYVPYNDMEALEKAIGPYTAAVMVEPIQGESGIRVPDADYLPRLRALCNAHGILMVLDEVQSGMGRTGKLWAHQWSGIEPDIMTTSKALASGVPMGACMAKGHVAQTFTPGTHGSTFGGNPLSASAALATLDIMLADGFLEGVQERGQYFQDKLREMADGRRMVKQVRGKGLMVAMELNAPAEEVASICLSRGLLLNCCMGTVLRFLPPLVVSKEEIDQAVSTLGEVLSDLF